MVVPRRFTQTRHERAFDGSSERMATAYRRFHTRSLGAYVDHAVGYVGGVTSLLGGSANPLGATVQYLDAPLVRVADALADRFDATATDLRLIDALGCLLPFEAPWSRLLLAPCGGWTAILNNGLDGGDSTAPGPALSHHLNATCVVACSVPRYGPGHEQTQLEVLGPQGEPPLMYVRALSATATDGRWEWSESGKPFSFERRERYTARRKRDRLDRPLLLEYLDALGIPADDDDAYGNALLLQETATYERRRVSLEDARAEFR
jgi:hypothetical protein